MSLSSHIKIKLNEIFMSFLKNFIFKKILITSSKWMFTRGVIIRRQFAQNGAKHKVKMQTINIRQENCARVDFLKIPTLKNMEKFSCLSFFTYKSSIFLIDRGLIVIEKVYRWTRASFECIGKYYKTEWVSITKFWMTSWQFYKGRLILHWVFRIFPEGSMANSQRREWEEVGGALPPPYFSYFLRWLLVMFPSGKKLKYFP